MTITTEQLEALISVTEDLADQDGFGPFKTSTLLTILRELQSLRRSPTPVRREALAEVLLLKLANAADEVGVQYFDTDTLDPPVQAMQLATQDARAFLSSHSPPGK